MLACLANIRVVLVETSHTGNIGSVARAMKTMGLAKLCLVSPIVKPDSRSLAMAAKAADVVRSAELFDTLEQAIADCQLVMGTSVRARTLDLPFLSLDTASNKLIAEAKLGHVAVVFGRERTGLTNKELQKCHYHLSIPTDINYPSLNLAMSVQIVAYEIYKAVLASNSHLADATVPAELSNIYPLQTEIEYFYRHLERSLLAVSFINPEHPGEVMSRLRRLYNRVRLEEKELNILRGILSAVDRKIAQNDR